MMPQMTITITDIFTTPDKFVNVKGISIIIGISISTTRRLKGFMQLFFKRINKQGLDNIILLIPMIFLSTFEDILPNVENYAQHPTIHIIISVDRFLVLNPQL